MYQVLVIGGYFTLAMLAAQHLHTLYVRNDFLYQEEFSKRRNGGKPNPNQSFIGIGPTFLDRDFQGRQRWIFSIRSIYLAEIVITVTTFGSFILLASLLPSDAEKPGIDGFLGTYVLGLFWLVPTLMLWDIIGPSKSKIILNAFSSAMLLVISHAATTQSPDWDWILGILTGSMVACIGIGFPWYQYMVSKRTYKDASTSHPVPSGITNYYWGTLIFSLVSGLIALAAVVALEPG